MTELQINQLIHEKVMGKCWHNADKRVGDSICLILHWFCTKCGDEVGYEGVYMPPLHPSYTSSWADYGPMLEECMKKEWFDAFLNSGYGVYEEGDNTVGLQTIRDIDIYYLNPLRGSTAIAEFLKERKP